MSKHAQRLSRGLFRLRMLGASIVRPIMAARLARHIPMMQRGFRFAQNWTTHDLQMIAPTPHPDESGPNRLRDYFDAHTAGPGIWKWRHYFDVYDRHLRKFVGREVNILEIGIFSGGSLEMWRDYLGDRCSVYGVDLDEACKVYENDYTKILIGDQADRKFWAELKAEVPKVDILIDDGGHKPVQQVVTIEEGLRQLKPGGIYVCEDIHGDNNGFAAYLQGMASNLNASKRIRSGHFHRSEFQRLIRSVHTYPFVTVIETMDTAEEEFLSQRHGTEWQPTKSKRSDPPSAAQSNRA